MRLEPISILMESGCLPYRRMWLSNGCMPNGISEPNECVCFGLTGCADEELFSEKCTHLPTWHSRVVPLRCPARVSSARNGTRSLQSGVFFWSSISVAICFVVFWHRIVLVTCATCGKPLTAEKTKHPRTLVTEKKRQDAKSIGIFVLPVDQKLHKIIITAEFNFES